MAEWLKAHAWKACIGETLSRVRIPVSPPFLLRLLSMMATLEIDDDLLERAEKIARERGVTTGQVVSELLRESIEPSEPIIRNGFEVFVDSRSPIALS